MLVYVGRSNPAALLRLACRPQWTPSALAMPLASTSTIPTIPRNSGPNRPCRYVTRPVVLSAKAGGEASSWCIVLLRGVGGCGWLDARLAAHADHRGFLSRSRRLRRRRAYGLDVPASVLPHDGHLIGHLEAGRGVVDRRILGMPTPGLGALAGELPHHTDRDPAYCSP